MKKLIEQIKQEYKAVYDDILEWYSKQDAIQIDRNIRGYNIYELLKNLPDLFITAIIEKYFRDKGIDISINPLRKCICGYRITDTKRNCFLASKGGSIYMDRDVSQKESILQACKIQTKRLEG